MKILFFIAMILLIEMNAFGQNSSITKICFQDSSIINYYIFKQKINNESDRQLYNNYIEASKQAQNIIDTIEGELTFKFNNLLYDAIIVNPKKQIIEMHWLTTQDKSPYKSLNSVKQQLELSRKVLMLTNGGMYLKNNIPQGLFISNGKELSPLDADSNKYGNFYMKPNGVFFIDTNKAYIETTSLFRKNYSKKKNSIKFATQSGPMLVINGVIHNKFIPLSKNLHLRSGVGILPNGNVVFIISRSNKTNFHDFAAIFKDIFGCQNALYLDGAISKMYLPNLRPNDLGGNFGVIISITE